jgi:hypothetical protein
MYPLALSGFDGRDRRPTDVGELRQFDLGKTSSVAMFFQTRQNHVGILPDFY